MKISSHERLVAAEAEKKALGFPPVDAKRYGLLDQEIVALKSIVYILSLKTEIAREVKRLKSAAKLHRELK